MAQSAEDQLTIIMTCLKHTANRGKPDFEAAGQELGVPSKLLYTRHWAILQKHGMTTSKASVAGSAVTSTLGSSAPATPTTTNKRGRPKGSANKKAGKAAGTAEENGDALDDGESPPKKLKAGKKETGVDKAVIGADKVKTVAAVKDDPEEDNDDGEDQDEIDV